MTASPRLPAIAIATIAACAAVVAPAGLSSAQGALAFRHPVDHPAIAYTTAPLADAATRLEMIRAAVGDDPRFVVDDREFHRPGPSYTILTLEEMRAERGAQPLVLILGMDAFAGIDSWHRAGELASLAHIVVAERPGSMRPQAGLAALLLAERRCDDPARLMHVPAGLVFVSANTQLDLSSSAVRAVIAASRSASTRRGQCATRSWTW